jgi:hypothetical protein
VDASSYGMIVSLVMIFLPESMALGWLSLILLFIYAVMIIISVSGLGGLGEAIDLFSRALYIDTDNNNGTGLGLMVGRTSMCLCLLMPGLVNTRM